MRSIALHHRFHAVTWCLLRAAKAPQQRSQHERQDHDADDVAARERLEHRSGNVGGDFLQRRAAAGTGTRGIERCRAWREIQQFVDMAGPGETRLPDVHDHQADRHRDGDVDQADDEQTRALAKGKDRTDEGIEHRKENERDGECLQQQNDEHPEAAEVLVAQPAKIGLLAEERAHGRAADHGDQNLGIEREAECGRRRVGIRGCGWLLRLIGNGHFRSTTNLISSIATMQCGRGERI